MFSYGFVTPPLDASFTASGSEPSVHCYRSKSLHRSYLLRTAISLIVFILLITGTLLLFSCLPESGLSLPLSTVYKSYTMSQEYFQVTVSSSHTVQINVIAPVARVSWRFGED